MKLGVYRFGVVHTTDCEEISYTDSNTAKSNGELLFSVRTIPRRVLVEFLAWFKEVEDCQYGENYQFSNESK
jgi:hypothetical protein